MSEKIPLIFGSSDSVDGYIGKLEGDNYIIPAKLVNGTRIRCTITDLVVEDFPSDDDEHLVSGELPHHNFYVKNQKLFEEIFQALAHKKVFKKPSDRFVGYDLMIDSDVFKEYRDRL